MFKSKDNPNCFSVTDYAELIIITLVVVLALIACIIAISPYIDHPTDEDRSIYLTLVNKQNTLPADWTNKIKLQEAKNYHDETFLVEEEALSQFQMLRDNLLLEEIDIELDSTYRSIEEQQEIWDTWSADPELGEEYCEKYLAVPGFSEHHTGLAIDVFIVKDGQDIRDNEAMLAEREIFAKIHETLANYGFILRYPEGKESITGYNYEPWHFRYVGSPDTAGEIMEQNLTLEEYLSQNKNPS